MAAILLFTLTGLIGALLHANTNLVSENTIVIERFIRCAPLLAPLLYANVGMLGLIALLAPREKTGAT